MHRHVTVTPYDILRLAKHRGILTTICIDQFLKVDSPRLKHKAEGGCVFLTADGCGVYSDRPLACRLYPLARQATARGKETFAEIPPEPHTKGAYGRSGTVGDYLSAQETEVYLTFADRYLQFYAKLLTVLLNTASPAATIRDLVFEHRSVQAQLYSDPERAKLVAATLDVDRMVGDYCNKVGCAVPSTLEAKVEIHLKALDQWLEQI